MGYDGKYGRITTERLEIPDDEPVFLFRARDKFLPDVLAAYILLSGDGGSPQFHTDIVQAARERILKWQEDHPDRVRTPDSRRLRALEETI